MNETVGIPPNDNGTCPKCGNGELQSGYGLMGGGIGAYTYCGNDDCEWFYKIMDNEEF